MNITIEQEALQHALTRAQGIVDKRHPMAVLTNTLLEAEEGRLNVIVTDLEVSLKQTIPAQVNKIGKAATSARTLFEIVRESTADEIILSSMENHWVHVSYGSSNFKLMGVNPEEHPGMPALPEDGTSKVKLAIQAGDFEEMIRKTLFAVSTDDTRSNLAGVYLENTKTEHELRMVATDGHRLAVIERAASGGPLSEGLILPRKGLAEVARMLPEESGCIELMIGGNEALVQLGDVSLSMRLVEGTFPDYKQVVPSKTPHIIDAERDSLLHTVRRVSILSSERARGVCLKVSEGMLRVSANNPDMGEASEDLSVEYSGPELEIGFNARYLQDVLSVLPERSSVQLGLGDEFSPGVIRGKDPGYCYVVMPMRI